MQSTDEKVSSWGTPEAIRTKEPRLEYRKDFRDRGCSRRSQHVSLGVLGTRTIANVQGIPRPRAEMGASAWCTRPGSASAPSCVGRMAGYRRAGKQDRAGPFYIGPTCRVMAESALRLQVRER